MQVHTVLLVALVAGVNAGEDGGWLDTIRNGISTATGTVKSAFGDSETAPYTVTKTVLDDVTNETLYEVRQYPARKWVCTSKIMDDPDSERGGIFMRLFAYITGTNTEDQSIPMTTPVSMMMEPVPETMPAEVETPQSAESEEDVPNPHKFTMCFYINQEFQENPPTPTSDDVYIEDRPALTVIAKQAGGYMSEEDWKNLAMQLQVESAAREEAGVDYSKFYRAGYDAPMKFWNRRNEVWYVKQA